MLSIPQREIVAIHDGARPLVSSDEIALTIGKAVQTGAACLVAPVTDTIKTVENNTITGTVDRTRLRRALTPQAFRYDILRDALAGSDLGEDVTDECYLAEKLGVEIGLVEGSPHNIKITHAGDIQLAELFMKQDA